MESSQSYYDQLLQKLDQFTRKFYINQLIRGSLYFVGIVTVVFLAISLLESQFYFGQLVRKVLSFTFLAVFLATFYRWIALPVLHYFRLGKLISHQEAARIIGRHFSSVQDKLLNVLQLKSQSVNYTDRSLIEASINQKAAELRPIPFIAAIDYSKNKKYIRFALWPMALLVGVLFWSPSLIKDSTARLVQVNKDFEKAAPFRFVIDPEQQFFVEQHGDLTIDLHVQGDALPAQAYVDYDNFQYRLRRLGPDKFSYTFKNVQKNFSFYFFSGDVRSETYKIQVLMKPAIADFSIRLEYPAYTGRKNETLQNIGDLVVPIGTRAYWDINALHTDQLFVRYGDEQAKFPLQKRSEGNYKWNDRLMKDRSYLWYIYNHALKKTDSVQYQLSIIPDQYPLIEIVPAVDSTSQALLFFFAGNAADDYGLSHVHLQYSIRRADGKEETLQSLPVAQLKNQKTATFKYTLDLEQMNLGPGDQVSYYFEVWDNDGVQGSKSTRSRIMEFRKASVEELARQEETNNEEIKDLLKEAIDEAKRLRENISAFQDKIRDKKNLEWQNKKDFEKLTIQHQSVKQKFENAKNKYEQNLNNQEQHSNPDELLKEKQQQLDKLFNETLHREMEELMQKIHELMQDLNKDKLIKMSEEFEQKNMDLTKEMERLQELFKQLELEKNLKDHIEKLRQLAEEQKQLSDKTEQKRDGQDGLIQKQQELNKKFEDLKKQQEALQKKNKELESPRKMEDRSEQSEDIKRDQKNAMESLGKSDNKNASKKQRDAGQKMEDMANEMEMEMQENDQEQAEEDIKMLRQLLENLVGLSFDQESVIKNMENTHSHTPKYVGLVQDQFRIKDNFRIIEDTLEALSKRVLQIESFVREKVSEIKANLNEGIDRLEDRRVAEASVNQYRVMKNLNDLAVMLSEAMNNMQKEYNATCNKPGSKACKKPGKKPGSKEGRVPMDKISEGQQKMDGELKNLQQKLKEGGKMSKEFAELAAKQAQLRKMLQDLEKDRKERGQGSSKDLQEIIEDMNKLERDLVNKQLTNETLKRQQEIKTRLLEAERAEREREWDEQRKSQTGTNIDRKYPPALEEYLRQRQAETEWFQHVSPNLRPFYKQLVEQYYRSLKKQG